MYNIHTNFTFSCTKFSAVSKSKECVLLLSWPKAVGHQTGAYAASKSSSLGKQSVAKLMASRKTVSFVYFFFVDFVYLFYF